MSSPQSFLLFLLVLGAVATGLRLFSGAKPSLPYPVALAAAGVVIGLLPGLRIPPIGSDLILLVFVPALVFEAALGLHLAELRNRLLPVSLLATVGVALTVILIGTLGHLLLKLDWAGSFLLGSIVAATDPIAVVSLLRELRGPRGLEAILEGESLFNDGTGVAVFTAVLGSIVSTHPSWFDATVRLAAVTAGGVVIGVAVGSLAVLLLRVAREAEVEIMLTLVVAYGSYLAADLARASGVVSVVCAGLLIARYGSRTGRLQGTQLHGFWSLLGFVLNAILFLLIGLALPTHRLIAVAGLALAAYLIMFAARAVPVYALLGLLDPRRRSIPWSWRHMALWGGLRGGLSVALALSVTSMDTVNPEVPVLAYGMVVLSLLIQGGLLLPVADALRLRDGPT